MKRPGDDRLGMTLVEVSIAFTIAAVVLLAGLVQLQDFVADVGEFAEHAEDSLSAAGTLDRIERELEWAQSMELGTRLTASFELLPDAPLSCESALGFPDAGYVWLAPGTSWRGALAYGALGAGGTTFEDVAEVPGFGSSFSAGTSVTWAGAAVVSPLAELVDGVATGPLGGLPFVGPGTGFAFRVPVATSAGSGFTSGGSIQWGAEVRGASIVEARSCLYFDPVRAIGEAGVGVDVNRDGDVEDVFDVGAIRRRTWSGPAAVSQEVSLGQANVLQERGAWGGDLDGDGAADPIFLWDPRSGLLRVTLFTAPRNLRFASEVERRVATVRLRNG